MQSDQEREWRRMRDSEWRQSMTSEQRERHLRRRRRNYKLRRQRVKHLNSGFHPGSNMNSSNYCQADGYNPMPFVQFGCAAPVGCSSQLLFEVHGEHLSRPEGKETLAYDLTKLQRRLRLINVKQFARSLKRSLGELTMNYIPILTDLIMKGNQVLCGPYVSDKFHLCDVGVQYYVLKDTCRDRFLGKFVHGVCLNRVKQLLR